MSNLKLVVLFAAACGGAPAPAPNPPPASDPLIGTWVSEAGETRPSAAGPLYVKRTFTFTASGSNNQMQFFSDETFTHPTMLLEFGGSHRVLGPSPVMPDATMAEFALQRLAITPQDPGMVGFLASLPAGTCGRDWQIDVRQELPTGCAAFGIDPATTVEHDIFKVEADRLYFGARPADGGLLDTTEKRPTSWQVPLARAR